ncbi:MAG: hypothetical protein JJU12_02630 [Chlamydiales bacterium]|nr:hypothetical protein [Chlamydiales bacterium]
MKQNRPENPFAFFHQNEALLYQFFLHESLLACMLVKETPTPDLLKQIMGESAHQFYNSQGHLPKMLHYYDLHMENFEPYPAMKSVGRTLDRALSAARSCADLIDKECKDHKKHFLQLRRELKKVGKLLYDLLPHYKNNPHVLYFVLCRHEQLDSLYGKASLVSLFDSLFEGGLVEVETFLSDSFSRKGFHHLLPNIQKQLETIQND